MLRTWTWLRRENGSYAPLEGCWLDWPNPLVEAIECIDREIGRHDKAKMEEGRSRPPGAPVSRGGR